MNTANRAHRNPTFPLTHVPTCLLVVALALPILAARAAEDLSATLQRGLFEEEANNNLAAAIKAYEAVVSATDAQRKLAGTALLRLAECYRKLGRTNDATTHYQRVLNEYPDQPRLVDLSRQYLLATAPVESAGGKGADRTRLLERELLTRQTDFSRLSTLHALLTNMTRAEARKVLPTAAPDSMLAALLDQRAQTELKLVTATNNFAWTHPEVKMVKGTLAAIDRQIDERLDGVLAGLKIKTESEQAGVAQLTRQLADARRGGNATTPARSPVSTRQRELILEEIKLAEQSLAAAQDQVRRGRIAPTDTVAHERAVLRARRELAAVDHGWASPERRTLLEQEIKLQDQVLANVRNKVQSGVVTTSGEIPEQRELIALKRELAALEEPAAGTEASAATPGASQTPTDEEDREVRRIQALIKDSPDLINARSGENSTSPLQDAARKGQLVVTRFLLANRADVNLIGGNSQAPLHEAAAAGHRSMTELLLTNGASIDARGRSGKTALRQAVESGFKSVVEVLLAAKADPNLADSGGDTPLHLAAKNNRALCEMLAGAGAQLDARNKKGRTPLSIAALSSGEVTEFLLSKGADPNTKDENQYTPLHYAAQYSQAKSIALLLSQKADPNLANSGGETPLHVAAKMNQPPVIQALLAGGASPNARNKQWLTPLWHAASAGSAEVTGAMLKAGGNPNLPNGEDANSSMNVLHLACSKGDKELVRLLLEAGGDPNRRVQSGYKNYSSGQWTPLLMAVADNSADVSHLLLEAKADPNHRPWEGAYTALILATSHGSTNLVADLLEHGADIEARDGDGSPLTKAIAVNDLDNIELLLRHKANPNTKSSDGSTPLHVAARSFKAKEVFELLLSHGADPNVTDANGRTPLELLKGGGPGSPGVVAGRSLPSIPAPPPSAPQYGTQAPRPVRTTPSVQRDPPKAATSSELADLLRRGGALDEVPLMDRIMVQRAAAQKREVVFTQSQSNWNQFTLLELIGVEYGFLSTRWLAAQGRSWNAPYSGGCENQFGRRSMLPFPDLAQVKIRRLAPDRKIWKEIKVDVAALLKSGDRARDVPLEWGDAVEIPELDHSIAENWKGFDKETLFALRQMLAREVTITVKGDTLRTNLAPDILTMKEYTAKNTPAGLRTSQLVSIRPDGTLETLDGSTDLAVFSNRRFTLHALLYDSGLLRSSSDASRVRVKRRATASEPAREWTLNAANPNTPNARPDLWLRDGDVIEVPEREP